MQANTIPIFLITIGVMLLVHPVYAQELWSPATPQQTNDAQTQPWVSQNARYFTLNESTLQQLLQRAPREQLGETTKSVNEAQISLPTPSGDFVTFSFVEYACMESGLAARYPGIRTFLGHDSQDPARTLRFDVSSTGFRARIASPNETYRIAPSGSPDRYVCYGETEVPEVNQTFDCGVVKMEEPQPLNQIASKSITPPALRVYRLAVACNGEYGQAAGGTVEGALAAIIYTVNQINAVYERDLSIRFVVVENNDQIINLDPASDPFSNDIFEVLRAAKAYLDDTIGPEAYDVSHVFGLDMAGAGGVAGGGVCGGSGGGVSNVYPPSSGFVNVGLVTHELGHQFGASHTFNTYYDSYSQRRNLTAYERDSESNSDCGERRNYPCYRDIPPTDRSTLSDYSATGGSNRRRSVACGSGCLAAQWQYNRRPCYWRTCGLL